LLIAVAVDEFPYSEETCKGRGECRMEDYVVQIRLWEVVEKVEKMCAGQRRSYPALRFVIVSLDTTDGSLYWRVGEGIAVNSQVKLV